MRLLSIVLSSAALLVSFTGGALRETCTNREPQPIGIDFGASGQVTASYAHGLGNVTLLAKTGDEEAYAQHVLKLQAEYIHHYDLDQLFALSKPRTIGNDLVLLASYCLRQLRVRMTFLDNPAFRDSKPVKYTVQIFSRATGIIRAVTSYRPWSSLVAMTLDDVYDGFVSALLSIQAASEQQHNQTIGFAIICVPEFFNQTLADLLLQAARDVGIQSAETTLPRTIPVAWGAGVGADTRALVLDQGQHYMTIRSFEEPTQRPVSGHERIIRRALPIDPYSSRHIDHSFLRQVLRGSPLLRRQIELGADEVQLEAEIARARVSIKNIRDVDIHGEEENDKYHHDEWLLNLPNWWLGLESKVFLSWKDVEIMEEEYAESLSKFLVEFLVGLRDSRLKQPKDGPSILETIDTVVITTDGFDGQLVRRAVIKTLGDNVNIVGGSPRSARLAAEGAAISAWRRRQNWEKLQETENFRAQMIAMQKIYHEEL